MSQLNIHTSPEFDRILSRFMKIRGLKNKSVAIRTAVKEGLEQSLRELVTTDFKQWIGIGNTEPENSERKFHTHDDLWR